MALDVATLSAFYCKGASLVALLLPPSGANEPDNKYFHSFFEDVGCSRLRAVCGNVKIRTRLTLWPGLSLFLPLGMSLAQERLEPRAAAAAMFKIPSKLNFRFITSICSDHCKKLPTLARLFLFLATH